MLRIVIDVVQQVIADQVYFDEIGPVPHQAHGVIVGTPVNAVADAVGAEQQCVANVVVGFVDLTGMNGKLHAAVLAS